MKQENMKIVNQIQLAPTIYELTLEGQLVQEMQMPGQFLHLKVPREDLLLRRPISIHEINVQEQTCKIIYRTEGQGTSNLSHLLAGDTLDVLGPLGNGFTIDDLPASSNALIIGGGIGVPPLYELSKQLVTKGLTVTHLFGFATAEVSYHLDKFRALGEAVITTDDGSLGEKGTVAQQFPRLPMPDVVFSCGNNGLLRAVEQYYHPDVQNVQLSLEARMACGIGACYACVCPKTEDKMKSVKVCDEGPIFQAGEVLI